MPEIYECGVCSRTFPKSGKLNQHMRIHTGERPYICDHPGCTKRYSRRDHLTRHVQSHCDKPKKYQCKRDGCDKSFGTRQKLERHEAVHNREKPFVCEHCGEAFTKRWMLAKHAADHDGRDAPYPCKEAGCTKSFVRPSALLRHENKMHRKDCKVYACADPSCSEDTFEKMSDLRRHMATAHSKVKQWECERCGMRFRNESRLLKHVETHDISIVDRLKFTCDVQGCSKSYTRQSNLNSHKKTAHSDVRISCDACLSAFTHKQSLQRHVKTCSGKRIREDYERYFEPSLSSSRAKKARTEEPFSEYSEEKGSTDNGFDLLVALCGEVPAVTT